MAANEQNGDWLERWKVLIGVVPVVVSIVGLIMATHQQVLVSRASAGAFTATATAELIERLAGAGRRFNAAEAAGDERGMQYEMSYMSARVEVYLVGTAEARDIVDMDPQLVPGGTVRVLASGLPCDGTPRPAGPVFAERGYPAMGALADEMDLRTC